MLDWVHMAEMVRSFAEFRKNHWVSAVVKPEVDSSRAVHLALELSALETEIDYCDRNLQFDGAS
jgi:hypothetical protein